jgi:hypothetical protein
MPKTAKISEFTTCARDELAKLANDNAPPEAAEAIHELMKAVLHPAAHPAESGDDDRPLDDRELSAIGTIIKYQANEFGVLSRLITLAVEIVFDVNNIAELRWTEFDAVVHYLVHLPGRHS